MSAAPAPDELAAAATSLAGVLEQENRLLEALDLAGAAQLLPAKQSAANAFVQAQLRAQKPGGIAPAARPAVTALNARLRALAADNRRLLERGMAAQRRVIAVIARAVRARPDAATRYDASGALAGARKATPLAISARI